MKRKISNMTETKHIIVTGGSRGIGKVLAAQLLKEGYSVTICAKTETNLKKAQQELRSLGEVGYRVLDLADRHAISKFVKEWEEPLYGIVNNAGVVAVEGIEKSDSGSWDTILNVNLHGLYFLTKGLVSHISDNGRIVNISSQLGKEGRAGYGAYCASKFAVIGLTKCWAKELGVRGITVNAVCPGWVKTEMGMQDLERIAHERGVTKEALCKEICEPLELKRFTEPEEVANLVTFLVSSKGSGITGRDWLMNTIWNQE